MGVLCPFFGLLLRPMIAGAAMGLGSLPGGASALRLRTEKFEATPEFIPP